MFTAVHSMRVVTFVICVLTLMSALPLVVRSQGSPLPVSTTDSTVEDGQGTTTPEELPVATTPVNPYTIEGVPGGGGVIGDFVVGPGKVDVTVKPGESKTVEMTVTNRTGERRIFNLTVEDAEGSTNLETPIVLLGADKGPYSLKDYITFDAPSFELDHNQRARVPVTISVPQNASPGGLYGSVLVNTVAVEAEPGDTAGTVPQSAIIARIGTLFFVTVPGAVERDGELKDFATVPEKHFFQSGPIPFGILFENQGSIHLAPYGELRVTNMLGEEVGFVQLEPWFVLPQSERLREVSWDRELLFGRYTATVQINRSYDDIVDTLSFSFWVLPWKLVLGAFATLFIVFFIIRAFFRNFEFKRKGK